MILKICMDYLVQLDIKVYCEAKMINQLESKCTDTQTNEANFLAQKGPGLYDTGSWY